MHFKYKQTPLSTFNLHHITIWPSITLFPNNQLQKDTESPGAADICVKDSGKTHRLFFSYLLEVATASPHEHHRIISVCVRSHGRHPVRAVVEQRNALNDPQSSERLVQNQAAEIITNLLGLRDKKKQWRVISYNLEDCFCVRVLKKNRVRGYIKNVIIFFLNI